MSTYQELTTEIFELINHIRSDPKNFASTIESTFAHYKSDNVLHRPGTIPLQTREGLSAAKELYEELQELSDLQQLSFSSGLATAANQHCFDTGPLGIVGHIGSRETSLQRRVESYGKWTGNLVEALDYGSSTAIEVVLALLVDDGLTTRPHRKALLNPSFSKIGVGAGPHSEFKTVVCVLFAIGYTENEDLNIVEASLESVPQNPPVDEWLEGAVKVTSEIREETVNGEKVRKIKNHWEMRDGSIKVIDKVEKIEPPKVEKKTEDGEEGGIKIAEEVDIEVKEGKVHGEGHHEEHHHDAPHHEVSHHEPTPDHEAPHHEVHHDVPHNKAPHHEEVHENPHKIEVKTPEIHHGPTVVHHESHEVHHEVHETHEKPHYEAPEEHHVVHHEVHVETHEVHVGVHHEIHEKHHEDHHEKPVEPHHEVHSEKPHAEHKKKKSSGSSSGSEKKRSGHKKQKSGSSSGSDKKKKGKSGDSDDSSF